MSAKKTQEGNELLTSAKTETTAAEPATANANLPVTKGSTGTGTVGTTPNPNTKGSNTVSSSQAAVGGAKPRPPRVLDIPGFYPNPGYRQEILYTSNSPNTAEGRKDVFIEIRALITGEGDKIEVSAMEQISRRWTFGGLIAPKNEPIPPIKPPLNP